MDNYLNTVQSFVGVVSHLKEFDLIIKSDMEKNIIVDNQKFEEMKFLDRHAMVLKDSAEAIRLNILEDLVSFALEDIDDVFNIAKITLASIDINSLAAAIDEKENLTSATQQFLNNQRQK